MPRYLRETNGSECCGVTPKNEQSNLKMLGEIIVFRFDMKSLENKKYAMVTLSKSLKYPQMRCKSSPTSTIPTALRFFRCPVRCEKLRLLGAGGQGRPDTPSGCFQGLKFFSEPIVMAEAAIHSNVVICQVPYHTCMAYLPTCAIWWIFMVHVGKYTIHGSYGSGVVVHQCLKIGH